MAPRRAGEIYGVELTCRAVAETRREKLAPVGLGEQRERDVSPCVEVVSRHDQFPKPGLAEVLRQQLRVAVTEIVGRRRRYARGATHDPPQAAAEPGERAGDVQRGPHEAPPERATRSTSRT